MAAIRTAVIVIMTAAVVAIGGAILQKSMSHLIFTSNIWMQPMP
jgi:hypothetical protein